MPRPLLTALLLGLTASWGFAENAATTADTAARAKSDAALEQRASDWVASLQLGDAAREARVRNVIATHLQAVRDWHNEHPFTSVPAGINPATGRPLTELDRQMIADSAMPRSVHNGLMSGLRRELTEPQVDAVLDKYTVGKVAFTLSGYHAIVPDLTADEEMTILGYLKQAREQAVDFKNMNQISAIFEIHKTRSEQFLIGNGRNWRKLYQDYVRAAQEKKKADAARKP